MRGFNEGKACDAVISRIEAREGQTRGELRFPEQEHHTAPVELVCQIGRQLFAFEHTSIEPFEQHKKLEVKAPAQFQPIQERLAGFLPPDEHFELQVPARATLGLRPQEIRRMQDALVNWIKATAPTLPIVRLSGLAIPLQYSKVPGVPFEVFLIRSVRGGRGGQLSVAHLVERYRFEEDRVERVRRGYERKCLKLTAWQRASARTVLIFEESDAQMTNHFLAAAAIHKAEEQTQLKPDEVYLLSSAIHAFWSLWSLRVDDHIFDDLSIHGTAITSEIDPNILQNLTGR